MVRLRGVRLAGSLVLGIVLVSAPACGGRRMADGPLRTRPAGSDGQGRLIVSGPWKDVWLLGDFTREDVDAIGAVVEADTRGSSRKWRRIFAIADRGDYVEAQTGSYCGTLCGSGYVFRLRKVDGRWTVVERSIWES